MWPENLTLQIDSIDTATGFGYSDCAGPVKADVGFAMTDVYIYVLGVCVQS